MKHLCWETTGFSFGLTLAALEGAMIHVENKQEGTASNMLYCMGMTMAQQLLSFTEGAEAGSVEGRQSGEICSIIFSKRCPEHKQIGIFDTITKQRWNNIPALDVTSVPTFNKCPHLQRGQWP